MDRGQVGELLMKGQQVMPWKGTKIFSEEGKIEKCREDQDQNPGPSLQCTIHSIL